MVAKVFIDTQGRFYKVEAARLEDIHPKNDSDMERPCISAEGLACLSDVPMQQVDWDAKVQAYLANPPEVTPTPEAVAADVAAAAIDKAAKS